MSSHKNENKKNNDNEKKIKIFEAGKTLFYEKGYYQASIGNIAEAAGVNRALISYYFDNKINLALQVVYELNGNVAKGVQEKLSQAQNTDNPFVMLAMEFRLYTMFRRLNDNYRRFLKELCQENIMQLGRSRIGENEYDFLEEVYGIHLSDIDRQIIQHSVGAVLNRLISMHSAGVIDCSYDYIAEKETDMFFRLLGMEASTIEEILRKAKEIYNDPQLNMSAMKIGKNFTVIQE